MKPFYFSVFFISLFLVLLFIPAFKRLAIKVGFVDMPSARKIHARPIPLGGGVLIYLVFLLVIISAFAILNPTIHSPIMGLLFGVSLIVLIGVYDDYYEMDPLVKMIGQIIAAIIFLTFVNDVTPVMSFPAFPLLAIVWIVSLQNALNFLDNMDGLCGGLSTMIGAAFGVLFVFKGMPLYALISFAISGAAIGFLKHNLPPASIFLGDAGSLFFGFTLSSLGVIHLSTSQTLADALAPVLIFAYPIFDLTFVVISRLNEGRKVYIGGKDHSSHKISFMGLTKKKTVFLIYIINSLLVISGVSVYFLIESPYRMLVVVVFALILAFAGSHLYRNFLFTKFRIAAILTDLFSFNITFIGYYVIKYYSGWLGYTTIIRPTSVIIPLIWINIFWLVIHSTSGIYDLPIEASFKNVVRSIVKSIIIGSCLFLLVNYDIDTGFSISIISVVVYAAILLAVNLIFRYIYFKIRIRYIVNKRIIKAIIVNLDKNEISDNDIRQFSDKYEIVGLAGKKVQSSLDYLGDLDDLMDILKEHRIARIAVLFSPNSNLQSLLKTAFYMETRFIVRKENSALLNSLRQIKTVFDDTVIISIRLQTIFLRFTKRILASLFALTGLLLTSPVFIYYFIKSRIRKSPFLIKREISGIWGNTIICYTFDNNETDNYKIVPGLPALLSVLRGNLSLVGKVPITMDKAAKDAAIIPGYWRRDLIKPGIWGPGHFGDERSYFEMELKYMKNMSILIDIYWIIVGPLKNLLGIGKKEYAGPEVY